ncbi:MAG: NB-ARC domain-containing protein [Candidatus Wallbacteria bacterium]|nr:NB-ARC domain-containing protein [Candidatus Wallbacteria bacterium]
MKKITPPIGFTGRDQELAQLQEKLAVSSVLIIAGMPGIGKTALACALASELEQQDSPGNIVLWLECRPGWKNADLLDSLMHGLSRVSGRQKYSLSESRSFEVAAEAIEDASAAVFIDDFHLLENPETIGFIVSCRRKLKTGSLVVISRRKPDLPPAERADIFQLSLRGLSDQAASELAASLLRFHGINSLEHLARNMAAKLCGHPYSLKLLTGLIVSGRTFSLDREPDDIPGLIEKYLFPSFLKELDDTTLRVLEILSLMRIPAPRDILDTLLHGDSTAPLVYLSDRHLIESDSSGFRLQDLLTGFVATKLSDDRKKEIHRQIAMALAGKGSDPESICEAYYHFMECGDGHSAVSSLTTLASRLHHLGSEVVTVENLIDHALSHSRETTDPQLVFLKCSILIRRKKFTDAEALITDLPAPLAADARTLLLFCRNRHQEVIDLVDGLFLQNFTVETAASLTCRKAHSLVYLSRLDEAANCAAALKPKSDTLPPMIKAEYFYLMTKIHYTSADVPLIRKYVEQELHIHKELKNWKRLTTCMINLAYLQMISGHAEEALSLSLEPLRIVREQSDQENLSLIKFLQSSAHLMLENYELAIKEARESLVLAERCENALQVSILHGHTARISTLQGNFDEAENEFQKSLQIDSKFWNLPYLIEIRLWYTGFLLLTGRIEEAGAVINSCRDDAVKSRQNRSLAMAAFFEHLCWKCQGHQEKSRSALSCYQEILGHVAREHAAFIDASLSWYLENVGPCSNEIYEIISSQGRKHANAAVYKHAVSGCDQFEIFIDFAGKKLFIDGQEKDFFGKRTLAPLLRCFCSSPGTELKTREIFKAVWDRSYSPESDASTFRMTLSRLRTMLDKENLNRFITQGTESSAYRFNDQCRFCVILPQEHY